VVTDPSFHQALQADPEAVVAAHGLSLDDEAVERGAVSVERMSLDAPRPPFHVPPVVTCPGSVAVLSLTPH
jgi:hypothetical protein